MTNQNIDESEATAVVPQRTFAQWLALCQTITSETAPSLIPLAALRPGEVRRENNRVMLFDIELYDLNVQPDEGVVNFLNSMNCPYAKGLLFYCLTETEILVV